MKRYYKEIEGNKVFFNGILIKEDRQIINPSEEMLLEEGWIEYVQPEASLEQIKFSKILDLQYYDKSDNVNIFYYNSLPMWLSREDRIVIKDRFEREKANGVETTRLYYQGQYIEVSPEVGIQLINAVAAYADKCFDVTEQHKSNINALSTKEEVEAYDYTVNYPEKLSL